jgi:PAS domain S-box-containing protein
MATEVSFNTNALEHMWQHARDGVFLIDQHRRYVLFSDALEKMTGFTSADVVDKDCVCADVLNCHDEQGRKLSSVLCPAKALLDGTQDSVRQRLQVQRRDGSMIWVETVYSVMPGPSGTPEYVMGIVRDITDAKARETELMNEITMLRDRIRQLSGAGQQGGEAGGAGSAGPMPAAAPHMATEESLRLDPLLARCEREAILRALDAAHGQRNRAAQMMGISRSRLYRRMEALGVDLKDHP